MIPVGFFGAVMGLAGFGLALRAASPILPVKSPLPEIWIGIALLALAILAVTYVVKVFRHAAVVKEEFSNPASVGFCAAFPVGMALVAAGAAPYSDTLAQGLWWASVLSLLAMQAWTLSLLFQGGVQLAQVNGGWLIVFVGGIVMPYAGLPLGHAGWSAYLFGASAMVAPFVMGLIFYRLLFGPELPAGMRPTWFILLVPPSLIYVNGTALWPGPSSALLECLYYAALPLAVGLLILLVRGFWRWPFGAPWWAFTFPLDALAGAAATFAKDHPDGPWLAISALTLALAGFFVVMVLVRSLLSLGTLFKLP